MLLSGSMLGRYQILEKLGQGGMAVVYKALDTRENRQVAIKLIRKEAFGEEVLDRIRKRFERKARALAKLDHPNIIKICDFGEFQGSPYFVMDLHSETTLKDIKKPLSCQQTARVLLPIALALAHAHQNGILHKDVKPSNILFKENGEPVLTDFGIAKVLEDEEVQTLTGTDVGLGTPEYMSPEQGAGKTVDWRTDLYALGIIFYELITAKKPFAGDTPMSVIVKQMTAPLPWPEDVSNLPGIAVRILRKTLVKSPQDRYENIGELFTDLKILENGDSIRKNLQLTSEYLIPPTQAPIIVDENEQITRDDYLPKKNIERLAQGTDNQKKNLKPIILVSGIFTILIFFVSGMFLIKTAFFSLQTKSSANIPENTSVSAQYQAALEDNSPTETSSAASEEIPVEEATEKPALKPDVIQLVNAANLSEIYSWEDYKGEMISWMSDNSGFFLASKYRYGYSYFDLFQDQPEDFRKDTTSIYMAALGTEAELFATTIQESQLSIWKHGEEQPLFTKSFEQFSILSLPTFSGDNQWVAGYFNNQVQVLSTENGELELGIDFPLGDGQMSDNPVMIFSFSDDSTLLAIGNNNTGEIQVWDIEKKIMAQSFKWHDGVATIAFSPDGKSLASGGPTYNGLDNICFWDVASGDLVFGIKKNNEQINTIDFSTDGQLFATGSRSGALRIWSSFDGGLIQTYKIDEESIDKIAFSPDGKYLLSAGQNNVLWGILDD